MDDEHDDDSTPEVQVGSEIETEAFADINEDLEADDVRDELTRDGAKQDATEASEADEEGGDTI
jgi:hypothetical protein